MINLRLGKSYLLDIFNFFFFMGTLVVYASSHAEIESQLQLGPAQ